MKTKVLYSTLLAMASMTFVGCSEVAMDNDIQPEVQESLYTLVANVSSAETRVTFTEDDAQAINLAWADGDSFSVYEVGGAWVADFATTDAANSVFETFDNVLTEGKNYIAVYPARPNSEATYAEYAAIDFTSSQEQVGTALDLNAACHMSDTFTVGENVNFTHNKAILSVSFSTSDGTAPTKMIFTDSAAKSYEVNFSEMGTSDSYTAYLMIEPVEVSAERTLDFTVAYGTSSAQAFSVSSAVSYAAGCHYTAPVADASTSGYTIISTADEFVAFIANPTTDAVLMNDIGLDGKTITIPTTGAYGKTFNGNGYSISNFKYNSSDTNYAGMFRNISAAGIVKNLTMVNSNISAPSYVGGICGDNSGTISNCHVVDAVISATTNNCGGIVGQHKGNIYNCTVSGTVGGVASIGGIAGVMNLTTGATSVVGCTSDAIITVTGANTGGIVGKTGAGSETSTLKYITDCTFTGSISSTANYTGGITGYSYYANIDNCYSVGTVTSTGSTNAAGISGISYYTEITNCVNKSGVTGKQYVAGISGRNIESPVSNCVNEGSITQNTTGTAYAAGVVGYIDDVNSPIINCENHGDLNADGNIVGGVVGSASGTVSQKENEVAVTDAIISVVAGCLNTGAIQGGATQGTGQRTGGVVGHTEGLVVACYNTGIISPTKYSTMSGCIVGDANTTDVANGGASVVGCFNTGSIATCPTSGGNNGYILGYVHGSTITSCYNTTVAPDTGVVNGNSGTTIDDISALNAVVSTMNEAIAATACTSYKFQEGTNAATDLPAIVAAN